MSQCTRPRQDGFQPILRRLPRRTELLGERGGERYPDGSNPPPLSAHPRRSGPSGCPHHAQCILVACRSRSLSRIALAGCGAKSKPAPEEVPSARRLPKRSSSRPTESAEAKPAEPGVDDRSAGRQRRASPPKSPVAAVTEPAATAGTALIPRRTLFGNPDKSLARISPDGTQLSYLAPLDGVLNVFVAPLDDPAAAKPVTHDKTRADPLVFLGLRQQAHPLRAGHRRRRGLARLRVDLAAGDDQGPDAAAEDRRADRSRERKVSRGDPGRPQRSRSAVSRPLSRQHRQPASAKLVQKNTEFAGFITDDDFHVRFATKMTPDGGSQLLRSRRPGRLEGLSSRSAWTTR